MDGCEYELLHRTLGTLRSALHQLVTAEQLIRRQSDEIRVMRTQIEAERQQFKAFFDVCSEGLIVTTFDGLILEANSEVSALFAVPHADMIRKPLVIYIAEEERVKFRSRLKTLYAIPSRIDLMFRVRPKYGPDFPAILRVGTVYGADKTPTSLRWTLRKSEPYGTGADDTGPGLKIPACK